MLQFHQLDESDFTIECRFEDGQVRRWATGNLWDPAPGDSAIVLEFRKDGFVVRRTHAPSISKQK